MKSTFSAIPQNPLYPQMLIDPTKNELLGSGMSARVYKAENPQTGSPWAVKVCSGDLRIRDLYKEYILLTRQLREAPHTVRAREFSACGRRAEFRMQRLKNPELFDIVVDTPKKLTFSVIENIIIQGLEALCYFKMQGVVHGDIKLENSSYDFETEELTFFDFGHSFFPPGETPIGGTIGYMSPEFMLNQPVSFEMDMWSFGIMIFICCTRGKMFHGCETNDQMIDAFAKQFGDPFFEYYGRIAIQQTTGLPPAMIRNMFTDSQVLSFGKKQRPLESKVPSWYDIPWKDRIRRSARKKLESEPTERIIRLLEKIFVFANRITPEEGLRLFRGPSLPPLLLEPAVPENPNTTTGG